MSLSYSTAVANAMFNSIANGGAPLAEIFKNSAILIYSGTRPTNADSAVGTATLLGTVTTGGLTFTPGSPTNGLNMGVAASRAIDKNSSAVWQFTGIANGTATWFRWVGNAVDSGGASTTLPRIDGTIATFGGDISLSSTTIVLGNIYTVNQFLYTFASL